MAVNKGCPKVDLSERFKPSEATRASTNRVFGTPLQLSPQAKVIEAEVDAYEDWKNYEDYLEKYVRNLETSIGSSQVMLLSNALRRGRDSASRRRSTLENAFILHKACLKFGFKYETYFMAVFMATVSQAESIREVAVCLFMSDKYEEMYAHRWQELFDYLKIKSSPSQVIEEELKIFEKMNFTVHRPILHILIIQFLKSSRASEEAIELANQILKVVLLEEPFFKKKVSDLAIAVCSLALSVYKSPEVTAKFKNLAKQAADPAQVLRYKQAVVDWLTSVSSMERSSYSSCFIDLADQILGILSPKPLKISPLRFTSSSQSSNFNVFL